jgi:hypothetical protein
MLVDMVDCSIERKILSINGYCEDDNRLMKSLALVAFVLGH